MFHIFKFGLVMETSSLPFGYLFEGKESVACVERTCEAKFSSPRERCKTSSHINIAEHANTS